MPIYEYKCEACGKTHEVLQRITEKPLKKCADCGGKLDKLISRTSFQLKGGGWYATGYASKGASTSGEGSKATNGGSPSDGTDTKKPDKPSPDSTKNKEK